MKRNRAIVVRASEDLARVLGLSRVDAHRWELRDQLVSEIIGAVRRGKLTHAQVAKRVKTSRTRITSILNRNIDDVSTDLLLRVLESLGYKVKLSVSRIKLAA